MKVVYYYEMRVIYFENKAYSKLFAMVVPWTKTMGFCLMEYIQWQENNTSCPRELPFDLTQCGYFIK